MREEDPDHIRTTDDVVARLVDGQDYRAAVGLDSALGRWQTRLGDDVARELLDVHARIGEHVVAASTELRQRFREQPKISLGYAADEVVLIAGLALNVPVKDMRGSFCQPQGDACFYVGARAKRWHKARARRLKKAKNFEAKTRPNLVVEIETRHDTDLPERLVREKVHELWQVTPPGEEKAHFRILNLEAPGQPEVKTSGVLPVLTAARLPEAFRLARLGQSAALMELLRGGGKELLATSGAQGTRNRYLP